MIIEELLIENFGQHKKISKKVNGSVLGLVGANGAGKSTILKALEWAIKGSISTEKNLRSCIYHIDNDDEEMRAEYCKVTLKFKQQGKQGEIMRKYTAKGTSSRSLVWDGEKPIKAAGKVDEKMRQILGADAKAIEAIVCIAQGEIHKLLTGTYTERRTLFTRLMLLSHFEQGSKKVAGYRESFLGKIQDLSGLFSDAELELSKARERQTEITSNLEQIPDVSNDLVLIQDMYRLAVDIASSTSSLQDARNNLSESERQLSVAKEALGGGKDLEQLQQLKDKEKALVALEADRANYKWALSAQAQWCHDYEDYTKVKTQLDELKRQSLDSLTYDFALAEAKLAQHLAEKQAIQDLNKANADLTEASDYMLTLVKEGQELSDIHTKNGQELLELENKFSESSTLLALYAPACEHEGSECPLCSSKDLNIDFVRKKYNEEIFLNSKLKADIELMKAEVSEASTALRRHRDTYVATNQRKKDCAEIAERAYKVCAGIIPQELDMRIKELREEIDINKQVSDKVKLVSETLEASTNRLTRSEAQFKEIATSIGHPEVQDFSPLLNDLPVPIEGELQEVRTNISSLESVGERFEKYTQAVELWKGRIKQEEETLESNRTKMATWENSAGLLSLTRKYMHELKEKGQTHVALLQATLNYLKDEYEDPRNQELGKHKEAIYAVHQCEDKLKKLEDMKGEQKHQQQIAEELMQVKDALSHDGVSRTFMDYKFQELAALTQNHLNRLDAGFTVLADPDEDLSFCFIEPTRGTVMPMSKLSGGEKVRLSIAFLLAVQELMIPEVGLLILDEPTTHVDEQGKSALRNLFMKLAQEFEQANAQIVVCDHSPILMSAFDDVIELK